ncbi:hypothetical protein ACFSTE_12785 [Aquimarina hainanensis]|uniref:Grasp-with-spasm system SPASM domain peptide maturase n=1 Tax=Aquimarina hainanensis TaxID=1578017 RepID=A0ABW5N832_9FLAO|nr:hypothetical protein [Aquimarina sp. TRL1]QKX03701.1 hypothetical protein HN014_01810 [Aquimarina sp. TRL1]
MVSQCTRFAITEGFSREILINYEKEIQATPKGFSKYLINKEKGNKEYDKFISDNALYSIHPKANGYVWNSFSFITNLIIDISVNTIDTPISPILNELLVEAIEIRYLIRSQKKLEQYLTKISGVSLRTIHIVIKDMEVDEKYLSRLFSHPLIKNIALPISFKKSLTLDVIHKDMSQGISFYDPEEKSLINLHITPSYELVSESKEYHTYFNRKLYISSSCQVKNAPESTEEFADIRLIDCKELKTIVQSIAFQKYWRVTKDNCDVCSDCEFRNICVDRRIPKQREERWYHEKECNYNPYINKWKGETGYVSLQTTGIISSAKTFRIDSDNVAYLNRILWEEI